MANHLLIESRPDFSGTGFCSVLARALARQGDGVAVLLVQNGVLLARAGVSSGTPAALVADGVALLADVFSLRERGIADAQLAPDVQVCELDRVIDRMLDGWKVIWH